MRISDWSSDVCASDLNFGDEEIRPRLAAQLAGIVIGLEFQLVAQGLEEFRRLAPVVGGQEHGFDPFCAHLTSPLRARSVPSDKRAGPPPPGRPATAPPRWHGASPGGSDRPANRH